MKRRSLYLLAVAVALLAAVTLTESGLSQQAQAPGQLSRVVSIKLKPGMGFEWEIYLKNELIPVMKKRGVNELSTWAAEFGDSDEYVMVQPLKSLAEPDGKGPLAVAGQDGLAALMTKLQKNCGARFSIIEDLVCLTIAAKPGYAPKRGVLVNKNVATDREAEFEKSSKSVMAAVGKTNCKGFFSSKLSLGGNENDYDALALFDSFADMEKFVPAFIKGA